MPKQIIDDDGTIVTWLGEIIENDLGVDCYSQCVYNEFLLNLGDFVLISNPDNLSHENRYDVAKITRLFEIVDPLALDFKYQAYIESYKRPSELPAELTDLVPDIDWEREIVLNPVDCTYTIPINSIYGKCRVMFCDPSKSVSEAIAGFRNKSQLYICRYKIVNTDGKLSLVPVSSQYVNKSSENTPRKRIVSPIKIVNKNSVQKVSKLKQNDIENILSQSDDESMDESPSKVFRSSDCHNSSVGARRNLNSSLNNASGVLMGSIVDSPRTRKNDLKMTIKVMRKECSDSVTPLKQIQYYDNELDNMANRRSASKRKPILDPQIAITPSKTPKSHSQVDNPNVNSKSVTNTPKGIPQLRVQLSRISLEKKNEPRRSKRNSSVTPSKTTTLETPSKSQFTNRNEHVNSVTDSPKSILKSSRFQGTTRRSISFNLQNEPERSKKSSSVTPPSKTNVITSTPSPAVSLRRSTRKASISQINLEESPADVSFGASYELDEESFESPPKKSRKTPSRTPNKTVNRTPTTKTPSKTSSQTPKRTPSIRINALEPVISKRKSSINKSRSEVQIAKESLHVSAVPKSLPCRENEFENVYAFIESKILDECGGCMYVSGVPGTGKTATITEVIKSLQLKVEKKKLPAFEFVEINGMRLTEPRQAYVEIYRQLKGQTLPWEQAHSALEKRFKTPVVNRKTTVLLVDELDILCNRRQDVVYNLLDWPMKKAAHLVVITIANTMDLPERLLMGRITSRLGLTRLTFQPYSYKQLEVVVQARLMGTNIFDSDAVQLVARKVASMSGDCRRALDICRRATEIAERDCGNPKNIMVSMAHVQTAFNEMITNPKVLAIKNCSKYEQLFLQAVEAEVARTGVDETNLFRVYQQFESICALSGVSVPELGVALRISSKLGSSRLLICEHSSAAIHQKIMLNVSQDDIYYALHVKKSE